MNKLTAIFILSLGSLASCEERKEMPAMSQKSSQPANDRAAAAKAHVRPALEHDLNAAGLKFGDSVFIRAFKEERQLELFVRHRPSGKFQLFRTYKVAASSGGPGPKLLEDDGQVPEGFYFVPPPAMNPNSQYHLSFNIGYPNKFDRAHGRTGSAIMIHGNSVSIGCLAMTDGKIEEIYTLCDAAHAGGQEFFRVHIFPFRMTNGMMEANTGSKWKSFWENLKQGYDQFEKSGIPPEVTVENRRYVFAP